MSDQCENQEEDIIKATLEGYDDELEDDEFGAELRQYDDNKECSSSGAYRSIRHTESDDCSNHEQSNQPSSSTMSSVPNQSFTSSAYSSRHTDNDEEEDDDDEEDDEDDEDTRERKRLRFRSERAILTPKPQSNSSQIPDSLENVILDDEAKKAIEESEQKRPFVRNQHRTSRPGNVFGNQPQKNNKIYVNPHFRNNGGHNFINSNAKAGPLLNAPMDFPLQPFNNIIYPNVVGVRPCIQPPLIGPPMANFRDPNFNHPPLFNANTVDVSLPDLFI